MVTTPHKHAALIKAWADGATIQVYNKHAVRDADKRWVDQDGPGGESTPGWFDDFEYRVKVPNVVRWCPVFTMPANSIVVGAAVVEKRDAIFGHPGANFGDTVRGAVRLEFNPDTLELVSATMEKP